MERGRCDQGRRGHEDREIDNRRRESYDAISEVAIAAARGAGDWILEHFGTKMPSTVKDADSVVTSLDVEAERRISATIRAHYPDHTLVGEELSPHQVLGAYSWAIDPIDGTRNFAAGVPLWAVSVAALEHGVPVAAAIYIPVTGELYHAARGSGAWLAGERLQVSSTSSLSTAVAMTDLHGGFSDVLPPETLMRLLRAARRTRMLGSVCCALCYVATGRFDIYYAPHVNLWDIAAGVLLVQEADGEVRAVTGQEWTPGANSIVAASPPLVRAFLDHLHQPLPDGS